MKIISCCILAYRRRNRIYSTTPNWAAAFLLKQALNFQTTRISHRPPHHPIPVICMFKAM